MFILAKRRVGGKWGYFQISEGFSHIRENQWFGVTPRVRGRIIQERLEHEKGDCLHYKDNFSKSQNCSGWDWLAMQGESGRGFLCSGSG